MSEKMTAQKLSGMIDYQTDSIVSKALIERKTGIVTLFAFDKGQALSEHTSPFDAMVYVLDGKVDISISGESYILEKEDMIIMPADEPHGLKAMEKMKMVLTMIKS